MSGANTYVEPTPNTSLNTARGNVNDSLRAILTNFKSPTLPTLITINGITVGEQDGMLFRSDNTKALYISDSLSKKTSKVGGNFTRAGIGARIENGITALAANAATYEIGELVTTVSQDATLGANARLYMCVSNSVTEGSTAGFIDVGAPQGYSIDGLNNITFSGPSVTGLTILATNKIGVNTDTPTELVHLKAAEPSILFEETTPNVSWEVGSSNGKLIFRSQTDAATIASFSNAAPASSLIIDNSGNVGIGTSSPKADLHVPGTTLSSQVSVGSTSSLSMKYTAPSNIFDTTSDILFRNVAATTSYATFGVASCSFTANRYFTQVSGSATAPNLASTNEPSTGIYWTSTSPSNTWFTNGSVVSGSIRGNGDLVMVGKVTSLSDERLKSNVHTITNALSKVKSLRGVSYTKDAKNNIGVIAQEVEKILPEVITEGEYKSVAYGNMVGLLIEAIKELSAEIETLRS